jgi:uncharacterized membrane protein (DUF106 family)
MQKQFKLMILTNAVFVSLFLFFDWVEYEILNIGLLPNGSIFMMKTYFPAYIYIEKGMPSGYELFYLPNFLLVIFVLATITNLYFLYKLQNGNQLDRQ